MRRADVVAYRHPVTGRPLELEFERDEGDEILTGRLVGDGDQFPIIEAVPRFCPTSNYAASFGYQWSLFPTRQLDSRNVWGDQSAQRLFAETGWPSRMEGQTILEAGSGIDMLAPAYDRPQTLRAVRYWFAEAGLVEVVVQPG